MSTPDPGFKPLPLSTLKPQTGYLRPFFSVAKAVAITSSALEVMTDLNFVHAAAAPANIDVETATQKMISRGVRSLLVTDPAGDVVGIVTSRDLIGPRPHQVMLQRGIPFAEVMVQDIMTPAADIEVIPIEAVLHARVGDVVMTLKNSGRQHALVVEEDSSNGKPMIRGIFSASQIARQLGIVLQQHELSQTFAQIDQAVKERS